MKQVLIDSNFLYSLYSPNEANHHRSQTFANKSDFVSVIPEIVLTEVAFLFHRAGGVPAVVRFLEQFAKSGNALTSISILDLQRAGEIMAAYPKAQLDFVDCVLMGLSERLNITQVCTYDRRDFSIFRPKHCDFLELFP